MAEANLTSSRDIGARENRNHTGARLVQIYAYLTRPFVRSSDGRAANWAAVPAREHRNSAECALELEGRVCPVTLARHFLQRVEDPSVGIWRASYLAVHASYRRNEELVRNRVDEGPSVCYLRHRARWMGRRATFAQNSRSRAVGPCPPRMGPSETGMFGCSARPMHALWHHLEHPLHHLTHPLTS